MRWQVPFGLMERQTFNAIYLAQNIGVALGAALGGFVAEFSFNYIFMANLIMYVLLPSWRLHSSI